MSDVAIRPVTADQHERGHALLRHGRVRGQPELVEVFLHGKTCRELRGAHQNANRAARSELILSAKANGLVAYRLGRVVGWCHAAPKSELLEVPGERAADIGAIVCFVVAPDQRREGIATQLLDAALDHLRSRGMKTAEAYPWLAEVDPARWIWSQYVGPLSMYVKAGFEIAERHEDSCVVRRTL